MRAIGLSAMDLQPALALPARQDNSQLVTFEVASIICALPLDLVREVVAAAALTRPNQTDPYVPGLLNLRGCLLPVISLRCVLGQHDVPLDPSQYIVIVAWGESRTGLIVDGLGSVLSCAAEAVQPAPAVPYRELLMGVFTQGVGAVFLLGLPAILQRAGIEPR